ncbi:hypothetical protein EB796_006729 [Bugula neritina]|uniref:Uncharacterized protein n=1 Tax=Bugula neritina TaxID=10212 RepID=A0A7J7K9Q6_BUGNE|nr:hypothetical protein EB796_006729 [Bugula neritina]
MTAFRSLEQEAMRGKCKRKHILAATISGILVWGFMFGFHLIDAPLPEKLHHNWLQYSESRDLNDTVNFEPCDSLLEKVSDVNQSDYRIQLITASPGSGSDWCYSAMAMLTGHTTDSVYNYLHSKSLDELPHRALYYKTHWPFMRHFGPVDKYLSTHPVRVVLLLRNPYDAGFSEFVR